MKKLRLIALLIVVFAATGWVLTVPISSPFKALTPRPAHSASPLPSSSAKESPGTGKFRRVKERVPGQYLVVLKDEGSATDSEGIAAELAGAHQGQVLHVYKNIGFEGFSARLSETAATTLSEDPRVDHVVENGVAHPATTYEGVEWALDRIDQPFPNYDNTYHTNYSGAGVNVYVIDTGIQPQHSEFILTVSIDYDTVDDDGSPGNDHNDKGALDGIDCNGHGTAVASLIAGNRFGVAKYAQLHSVRAINCTGLNNSGTADSLIRAIEWVKNNHLPRAVANISAGIDASPELDTAVRSLIASGVTVVAAAGNKGVNASNFSPGRVPEVFTVGATSRGNPTDVRWVSSSEASNYGPAVDIFAPGANVTSAWICTPKTFYVSGLPNRSTAVACNPDTVTATVSGTSFAAPHVTGVVALYLEYNPLATPALVQSEIIRISTKDMVQNVGLNSNNRMLRAWDDWVFTPHTYPTEPTYIEPTCAGCPK